MRKILVVASLLVLGSSFAHGEETNKSIFGCVDLANGTVDGQCTASIIESGSQFQLMQRDIEVRTAKQDANMMATTQFYPSKMLIKVIAHKEQLDTELVASLN